MDESAHTTSRKSAGLPRLEIITRGERRRRSTPEQKREIVAESCGPELTPTEVARRFRRVWRHRNEYWNFLACVGLSVADSNPARARMYRRNYSFRYLWRES